MLSMKRIPKVSGDMHYNGYFRKRIKARFINTSPFYLKALRSNHVQKGILKISQNLLQRISDYWLTDYRRLRLSAAISRPPPDARICLQA